MAAPVVASYSPMLPVPLMLLSSFATKRLFPEMAMLEGNCKPETSALFMEAPVVALYSLIDPRPARFQNS